MVTFGYGPKNIPSGFEPGFDSRLAKAPPTPYTLNTGLSILYRLRHLDARISLEIVDRLQVGGNRRDSGFRGR